MVVGVELPAVGQRVRRCAAPRQTQRLGLQGRAVCGSSRRTQSGYAIAGGTCGRMVAWDHGGLRCVPVVLLLVAMVLCAVVGARAGGDSPLLGALQLVEQDFEEVGLVCWG